MRVLDTKAQDPEHQSSDVKSDFGLSTEQKKLSEVLKEIICCKIQVLHARSGSLSALNGYYRLSTLDVLQQKHIQLVYAMYQLDLKPDEFLAVHDLVERETESRMFKALSQYCSMDVFV